MTKYFIILFLSLAPVYKFCNNCKTPVLATDYDKHVKAHKVTSKKTRKTAAKAKKENPKGDNYVLSIWWLKYFILYTLFIELTLVFNFSEKCSICDSTFNDAQEVRAHQKEQHPNMCYICNVDAATEEDCLKHIEENHVRYLELSDQINHIVAKYYLDI